jgi:predicted amidohydrolase YtcJ
VTDIPVTDHRVAAIGSLDRRRAPAGHVEVVDGAGGTLPPGLRDRHVRMDQWAIGLHRVGLGGANCAVAAVAAVDRLARAAAASDP